MKIRISLMMAMAVVGIVVAAVKFEPPTEAARSVAAAQSSAPERLRPFMRDALYQPLADPRPGEWLAEHPEPEQSVGQYNAAGINRPTSQRKVLYLMPLGEFPEDGVKPPLEVLRDYLGRFFRMEARLAPPVPLAAAGAKTRINQSTGKPQTLSGDLLNWLPARLPADAYCLLAVTMADLYLDESWNFVFGQATLRDRVGVFSLARLDPAFFGGSGAEVPVAERRTMILRRACHTLSHETGHMFGWKHCKFYQCLMGGMNHQEESDRSPSALCPVCLHKLYLARTFDPVARQTGLVEFYETHGLIPERDAARRVLAAAQGNPPR